MTSPGFRVQFSYSSLSVYQMPGSVQELQTQHGADLIPALKRVMVERKKTHRDNCLIKDRFHGGPLIWFGGFGGGFPERKPMNHILKGKKKKKKKCVG